MTGLIILASGVSARLGKPKQNLLYNGKTLLQNAIETGLIAECRPVIVVLGANAEQIEKPSPHPDVNYIYNADWEQGMASSIVAAINELEKDNIVDMTMIMVCDQPFVTPVIIDELVLKQQTTGKAIIGSIYNNTIGVPALFTRQMFQQLKQLNGHEGARKIMQDHPQEVATIQFEKGSIDIDTEDDYKKLFD